MTAAAVGAGAVLFGTLGGAGAGGRDDVSAKVLRESPWCGYEATTTSNAGSSASPMQQTISVTVPATAIITLDRKGRVASALTNTGCAPRAGDDVYVRRADGSIDPTPTHTPPAVRWVGDFTSPGVSVDQRS